VPFDAPHVFSKEKMTGRDVTVSFFFSFSYFPLFDALHAFSKGWGRDVTVNIFSFSSPPLLFDAPHVFSKEKMTGCDVTVSLFFLFLFLVLLFDVPLSHTRTQYKNPGKLMGGKVRGDGYTSKSGSVRPVCMLFVKRETLHTPIPKVRT
jgi:hypothetical protein